MARLVGVRQFWTFVGWYVGCVALLALAPLVAHRVLAGGDLSTGARAAAVACGVLALVPWWPFMAWVYRRSDEFERHRMLLGLATAFGVAGIGMALLDYLELAGFVAYGSAPPRWELAVAGWAIGMAATAIHGRQRE